jgi:uncharacterized protein
MSGEESGHDWFHVDRVRKNALRIAEEEKNVDLFLIQIAALLHDIGDWKLNNSGMSEKEILEETCVILKYPPEIAEQVVNIVLNMSYSKNIKNRKKLSLEGQIVQDADRIDAMGAIGIARAFAYGGKDKRELYNPTKKPQTFKSIEAYKRNKSTTVNHFYEKIFRLTGLMNTKSAKKLATKRERFMKEYLDQFYSEWKGMI